MAKLVKSDIEKIIPHRFPFLLIDEILEVEPGVRIKGVKHVNEDGNTDCTGSYAL